MPAFVAIWSAADTAPLTPRTEVVGGAVMPRTLRRCLPSQRVDPPASRRHRRQRRCRGRAGRHVPDLVAVGGDRAIELRRVRPRRSAGLLRRWTGGLGLAAVAATAVA